MDVAKQKLQRRENTDMEGQLAGQGGKAMEIGQGNYVENKLKYHPNLISYWNHRPYLERQKL